jgi:hypothetical protein
MRANTISPAAARGASRRARAKNADSKALRPRRTTITLSPESQEIVERFKSANGASTSAAVDQIIQRSEPKPSRLKNVNGFLVLDLPGDGPKVRATMNDIKRAEDEMDQEYLGRFMRDVRRPGRRKKQEKRR